MSAVSPRNEKSEWEIESESAGAVAAFNPILTDHINGIREASRRRSVVNYVKVGKKTVMVRYSLVHSNNQKELMKARQRRRELNNVVEEKPARLKIAKCE